jgi:uncharacterized peroxidase-related enzyme
MPGVAPLPVDALPRELAPSIERYMKQFGFIPNSIRTMARKPKIAQAFGELTAAIAASLTIPPHLRGLVFHISSYAAGCRYCQAHSIGTLSHHSSLPKEKLSAIWDYERNPMFTPAERAAMRFGQAAAAVPNAVTEKDFAELHKHYTDEQIVEIVAVIALGGFLNRWNDTMGTTLEEPAVADAAALLGEKGWEVGKHAA